jgi:CxxC motif-containing protein (DUF1111 family)
VGLLEAIPEGAILALADPFDRDGDGVSGRSNHGFDRALGRRAVGRFGWKAAKPTVASQIATAFLRDLGLTTPILASEEVPAIQEARRAAPSGSRSTLRFQGEAGSGEGSNASSWGDKLAVPCGD